MNWYNYTAICVTIILVFSVTMAIIDTYRESKGKKPFLDMKVIKTNGK